MNKLLTILFLFICSSLAAQNFMPSVKGSQQTMLYEYYAYAFWMHPDWKAEDTNSVIVLNFGGAGQTSHTSMWSIEPMKYLAQSTWPGYMIKNNGDTIKYLHIGIKDTSLLNTVYDIRGRMVKWLITTLGVDTVTSPKWRFQATYLSAGANMFTRVKNRFNAGQPDNQAYMNLFRYTMGATITNTPDTDYSPGWSNGVHRIHFSWEDTHGSTPPGYAINLYNKIKDLPGAKVDTISYQDACHCIWQKAFVVTGLTDPAGTHAHDRNEWRILANDQPYTEPEEPTPTPAIKVRMRIKIVTD